MPAHSDPDSLAKLFLQVTLGQWGTNVPWVYRILANAHAQGTVVALNSAVGRRMNYKGSISPIEYVIGLEMSGSQKAKALEILRTGREQGGAGFGHYVAEGFIVAWEEMGAAIAENPLLAIGVGAGVIVLATVCPFGATVLAYTVFTGGLSVAALGGFAAATADTPVERAQAARDIGHGLGLMSMAAPAIPKHKLITTPVKMFARGQGLGRALSVNGILPALAPGKPFPPLLGPLIVGTSDIPEGMTATRVILHQDT